VEERHGVAHMDKEAMQQETEEFHKVEILDKQLLQFSSGAEALDSNWAMKDWAKLETQVGTLTELLQKLQQRPVQDSEDRDPCGRRWRKFWRM
jgi:hypothetical protein